MKNKYIVLFCLITICACKTKECSKITEFPHTYNLQAKTITIPSVLLKPTKMFVLNDTLVVYNNNTETCFELFSLPDCRYLNAAGPIGRGADELIRPNEFTINCHNNKFEILDVALYKTCRFQNGALVVEKSKRINHPDGVYNGFIALSDTLFCFTNWTQENEFIFIYNQSGKTKPFGNYPNFLPLKDNTERYQAYYKYSVPHPSGQYFASFYLNFKSFRIFDSEGTLLSESEVLTEPYKKYNPDKKDENLFYYTAPFATNEYIYVYCLNQNMKKMDREAPKLDSEVHVFNWEGEAISKLRFDKPITSFAIADNKLYATSFFHEDEIYVYDLPMQ